MLLITRTKTARLDRARQSEHKMSLFLPQPSNFGERYVVRHSAASMPGSCWGEYRRIAILEVVNGGVNPRMISARARGVVRIVQTWEKLNVGRHAPTGACAFSRAWREAVDLCGELNRAAVEAASMAGRRGLSPDPFLLFAREWAVYKNPL